MSIPQFKDINNIRNDVNYIHLNKNISQNNCKKEMCNIIMNSAFFIQLINKDNRFIINGKLVDIEDNILIKIDKFNVKTDNCLNFTVKYNSPLTPYPSFPLFFFFP